MTRSPTHEAALEYAARNWYVFPVEPPRAGDKESGKRPIGLLVPRGKDDATVDPAVIDAWFARVPDANIGIALEKSRLVALDVDVGAGKQGAQSLAEFDNELPETLTAITGGAGLHALYCADDAPAMQALAVKPGIDIIGKGYIVAAPSRHWTGGVYRWHALKPIAPLPPVLRRLASERAAAQKVQLNQETRSPIDQGGRNIALFRLGAVLRDQGIGPQALAAALHHENQQRCVPPLDDRELMLIVDSVMKRVHPTRDVAANAVLAEEARSVLVPAPEPASIWAYEIVARETPPMRFFETGFPQLDSLLGGGISTRHNTGIIGPPSAGKSAFVTSVVDYMQAIVPVLVVSTELPRDEVGVRHAALRMGFPWRDGIKGLFPRAAMSDAIRNLRVRIIGTDTLDRVDPLGQIYNEARAMAALCGMMPVIVVDYVQMLARAAEDKIRSKVGELSMGLRIMSQVLDTAVISVFATKRDFYGGGKLELLRESDDPTVYLAAAKESGDIEFDCATLLFLDVDKRHEGQPKPSRIAVARCRVGDIGFAGARAQLDVGRWYADAAAAVEMTAPAKNDRKNLEQAERDIVRLIDLITRMPGRPWREIRIAMGTGSQRADLARAKLMEAGRLENQRETFYDSMHRKQTRDVLRLVGAPTIYSGNANPLPGVIPWNGAQ